MTLTCSQCGYLLREGARWCDRCGAGQVGADPTPARDAARSPTAVPAPVAPPDRHFWQQRCPRCGRVSNNMHICGYCGADLQPAAPAAERRRFGLGQVLACGVLAIAAVFTLLRFADGGSSAGSVPTVVVEEYSPTPAASSPTPAPPAATPTPDQAALVKRVDTAWAMYNWAEVVSTLERLRQIAPDNTTYRAKLYDAYMSYGAKLKAGNDHAGAAAQFNKALALEPGRLEASAQITALTPTATPTPNPTQVCAAAQEVDPRAIAADPNAFKGKAVRLTGTISSADFQYAANITWVSFQADIPNRPTDKEEPVLLKADGRPGSLNRGRWAKVCAGVIGTEEVDLTGSGNKKRVPALQVYALE